MRFFVRYARDIKAAKPALLLFEVGESGLSSASHLLVAVVGETFERADRRRRGREPKRFDRGRAQRGGLSTEQATTGLGELDQRLYGGRAADPAERQNQLPFHLFVHLLLHRSDERHRQRARLLAADAECRLHPDAWRLVAERVP